MKDTTNNSALSLLIWDDLNILMGLNLFIIKKGTSLSQRNCSTNLVEETSHCKPFDTPVDAQTTSTNNDISW